MCWKCDLFKALGLTPEEIARIKPIVIGVLEQVEDKNETINNVVALALAQKDKRLAVLIGVILGNCIQEEPEIRPIVILAGGNI